MSVKRLLKRIDWFLLLIVVSILALGLLTTYPSIQLDEQLGVFYKQLLFVILSPFIIIAFSAINYSFLRSRGVGLWILFFSIFLLVFLLLFAPEINSAKSWIILFGLSIQPVDFIKIALIVLLARYFTVRHVQIKNIQHILFSAAITGIMFLLVLAQPDLGSSLTIVAIWFGIVFVSGISKKHLLGLLISGGVIAAGIWRFLLLDFQKERIVSFLNPLTDITGAGYNAFQSKVAVGSGEIFGKGVGMGTQSKQLFLPEYQSDFIFAAFAEEWGLIGVILLFSLFTLLFIRLFSMAKKGHGNFETLFIFGVLVVFFTHFLIHVAVNIGLAPVTGITLPLMSHGGSHIIAESIMLGMVISMSRSRKRIVREELFHGETPIHVNGS